MVTAEELDRTVNELFPPFVAGDPRLQDAMEKKLTLTVEQVKRKIDQFFEASKRSDAIADEVHAAFRAAGFADGFAYHRALVQEKKPPTLTVEQQRTLDEFSTAFARSEAISDELRAVFTAAGFANFSDYLRAMVQDTQRGDSVEDLSGEPTP